MTQDDLINQRLGQYEIRSLLGRGGMATVYLARQKSMDRDVAIKIMARELADDEEFVARFEHEAQLIARLQHPHILPVIDFGREDKHIYIVMRLVRGGSLDDRLKEGPLPLNLASRMLDQIASALSFAHEQGIIHRDLKPNNVLLDERNNPYLTDFGIAKMLAGTTKLTATGKILGTPAYMAPEQWRGDPVDARTDIYSLGVMLYEMVLGRLPFSGETPYTLMYKHFNDPPPPPRMVNPDLPPAIEAVVLRSLAKDADARYQSAEDVAADFGNAVRGLPTSVAAQPGEEQEKTLIGDDVPPPADEIMTMRPAVVGPAAGVTGPGTRAPAPTAAAPTRAGETQAAAPPQKRGINPIMIGAALVAVIAVVIVVVLMMSGGDNGKKVAELPTATDTLTPTDLPTNTPRPTDTYTPTLTLTPTDTYTPTLTATFTDTPSETPSATPRTTSATILSQVVNVRRGPGLQYEVIGTLARDEEVVVLGVSEDGQWYQVAGGGLMSAGWVSAELVRISGNPNIRVIPWPTDTPVPSDTPTPSDTPSLTPTITETPAPTATDTPAATETPAMIEPERFVPTEFERVGLAALNITLDYPTNWPSPVYLDSLEYAFMRPDPDLSLDQAPYMRIARGTPVELVARNFTENPTSPTLAIEDTYGVPSAAHRVLDGTIYPTYWVNRSTTTRNNWAFVIVIAPEDWLYVIAYAPLGDYDKPFEQQVLLPMIHSLQIDGVALTGGEPPIDENAFDPALFVPAEFKPVSLDTIGVTLDYPATWVDPLGTGIAYNLAPVSSSHPRTSDYPNMFVSRGTPDQIASFGLITDASSITAAIESTLNNSVTAVTDDTLAYLAYKIDQVAGGSHAWIWLVEIGAQDWLHIIVVAPAGEYDEAFGAQVLKRMLSSMQIDGNSLIPPASETTLNYIPLQLGSPVLDRYDSNENDWRFATIIDSQLVLETPELNYLRWSYPAVITEAGAAFYAQVTGELVSNTNYYSYGLTFRILDSSNFYVFLVNHLREYALYSWVDGDWTEIFPPTHSSSIQVGTGTRNTVGILVIGDYIELYVNGEMAGAVVDDRYKTGDVRPSAYVYTDSDSLLTVAFDDFAFVPLNILNNPVLTDERTAVIGTVSANNAAILTEPDFTSNPLFTLSSGQQAVILGRTADRRFLFGYARQAVGWIDASRVTLTREGMSVGAAGLPAVAQDVAGLTVHAWPVVWPEETGGDSSTHPALPGGATINGTLAYGGTAEYAVEAGASTYWTFEGRAGDVVTIGTNTPTTPSLDVKMVLYGPDGAQIDDNDDDGPGLNPLIEGVTLPANGQYLIVIEAATGAGTFVLTLEG